MRIRIVSINNVLINEASSYASELSTIYRRVFCALKFDSASSRLMSGYLMRSTHQTGRCFYECDWHCLWMRPPNMDGSRR